MNLSTFLKFKFLLIFFPYKTQAYHTRIRFETDHPQPDLTSLIYRNQLIEFSHGSYRRICRIRGIVDRQYLLINGKLSFIK